jgi:hypothetical protein
LRPSRLRHAPRNNPNYPSHSSLQPESEKVGGTNCAAPSETTQTTQVNQTSSQRVKRWVVPISKGGWHQLRSTLINNSNYPSQPNLQPESKKVGGTDLSTDLKRWVAPIAHQHRLRTNCAKCES